MLKYFIEQQYLAQVKTICEKLDEVKQKIQSGNYENLYELYDSCKMLFEEILTVALNEENEELADAQFVYRKYFQLFCELGAYFNMLKNKMYKNSWDKLQDCMDLIKCVGRYVEIENRMEVEDVRELLEDFEKLYPYEFFSSGEFVIGKSHCSICGKSMQGLECPHIKGNLYWGQVSIEVIDEIKQVQAVSIVKHPKDKRCILELSDDNRSEEEKFAKLNQFLDLHPCLLRRFSIKSTIETRLNKSIIKTDRNAKCTCGSGKKFKKCCEPNLYYKHEDVLIIPEKYVHFIYTQEN